MQKWIVGALALAVVAGAAPAVAQTDRDAIEVMLSLAKTERKQQSDPRDDNHQGRYLVNPGNRSGQIAHPQQASHRQCPHHDRQIDMEHQRPGKYSFYLPR